ncbi:ATP-dependent DNA ligase [Roseibacterium beibuensis]|uniref:ATP-dependent DNA ligase n=1 Tax=[Roseibacterium] beibuensis TaxID=1193142 RepID=UPI00217CDE68|nr:ATP-dependent DNA ligase [Roseibacterium beibuensis]MCS6622621.1 ATP-dependent DNA ligase [Roseibacterium beibuensis]
MTRMSATPMEARTERELPGGEGWWFEPKWDGFRCLAFKSKGRVELLAKSGKSLARFFPEVVERLMRLKAETFGLDGELLAQEGDRYAFEVLQQRLHPAESRIRKLAAETPATFALFDMLVDVDGADLGDRSHRERHERLEAFVERFGGARLTLSPGTDDPALAQSWLEDGKLEGVVAKRRDGPYLEGERAMVKVKRLRSADCVVGGFRYASTGGRVGSLLLGLYDDAGLLNHVGFTSGFSGIDRDELTRRLEGLRGGPGFTGRAPGGPSRWATERSSEWEPLSHKLVVEVGFDHVSDQRFRHGTRLLRFRPDKAPGQCRMEQLEA